MKCVYCGKDLQEGSKFCDGCGAKQESQNVEPVSYQNDYQQGGYQPSGNKKNVGLIIAIIAIAVVVVGVLIIFLVTSGGKKDNSDTKDNTNTNTNEKTDTNTKQDDNEKTDSKTLADNIEYKDFKLDSGEIILQIKNNNKVPVSLEANIEFINKDNVVVDHESGYSFGFDPDREVIIYFYDSEKEYDNYKISFDVEKELYYESQINNINVVDKDDKENEEVVVTVTNNSNKKLEELRIGVLFYKNGKAVGYDEDSEYDVDAGKAIALYIDYPYVGYGNTFEFDEYKLFVLRAYSSNSKY